MKLTAIKVFIIALALSIPTSAWGYRFAVVGDSRNGHNIHKSLLKIAEQWHAKVVFNTGDIITHPGDEREWKDTWKVIGKQPFPYLLVVGNHDVKDRDSERIWKEQVKLPGNELYYKYEADDILFVVLDTCVPGQYQQITGKQYRWLEKTLDPKKYRYQFVFLHHPLYLLRQHKHYGNSLDQYPKQRDKLHKLFLRKGVTAVFEGHEHTFANMKEDGLPYIITGGGGAKLYSKYCHIIIVDAEKDGVKAKVIDWHGVTRKTFFIK